MRKEISKILEKCKANEEKLKLKLQKNIDNEAKKHEDLMRSRSHSYTLSDSVNPTHLLPHANSTSKLDNPEKEEPEAGKPEKDELIPEPEINKAEKDESILPEIDKAGKEQEPISLPDSKLEITQSEVSEEISRDKEALLEVDNQQEKESIEDLPPQTPTPSAYSFFQPEIKTELKDLIEKQKEEYLNTMAVLKRKFADEQKLLLLKLQSAVQLHMTSTPLNNVSIAPTEDEEFTEFQTCLQSIPALHESSSEQTLTDERETRERAATVITAAARGYLVRRLMNTIYVQECIRNIQDTLELVLSLTDNNMKTGNEIQDILFKTTLFKQLQTDLYRFNTIFLSYSTADKMKLISSDRERRRKKLMQDNQDRLNQSLQAIP